MNDPIQFFSFTTAPLELISFVLAMLTVFLNMRQSHWAWLFAILSSATYAGVFLQARLYGDTGLQLVFILVSLWGWRQWLRGDAGVASLPVTRLTQRDCLLAGAGWLAGFALLSVFLKTCTDTDVPAMDGFLTAGSLLGQLLLSRKKLENWLVWIAVDLLYVGLYLYKGLMLTAVLYGLFVPIAWLGWRTWRKAAE